MFDFKHIGFAAVSECFLIYFIWSMTKILFVLNEEWIDYNGGEKLICNYFEVLRVSSTDSHHHQTISKVIYEGGYN